MGKPCEPMSQKKGKGGKWCGREGKGKRVEEREKGKEKDEWGVDVKAETGPITCNWMEKSNYNEQ